MKMNGQIPSLNTASSWAIQIRRCISAATALACCGSQRLKGNQEGNQ
jgi:hypothetical protein